MRTINLTFPDREFNKIKRLKNRIIPKMNWEDFIIWMVEGMEK